MRSYFLIIFYPNDRGLARANLTIFVSRLGDLGFLVILTRLMKESQGNLGFSILEIIPFRAVFITFFFFFVSTKRPQVPVHRWLLAAISAPTPISALVHSSTLVTAGLYILYSLKELVNSLARWEEAV